MADKTLNDIAKDICDLYERIKNAPIDPTRRVFIDTTRYPVTKEQAVEFFNGTEVHTHFPDGSEYFNGSLLKGPDPIPAWSASPEALRKINARIAAMDLPTKGHRHYTIGRGNMKGGGGPWIVG